MGISLSKGGNVSLTKQAPGLKRIVLGVGWDTRMTDGAAFDLDAVAFLVGEDGKVRSDNDFIFYNNLTAADGAVQHKGDNLTGAGDGDDEQVFIDLEKMPADVQKVIVAVTIHEADQRGQNFGQVSNAFARVFNADDEGEIVRYDLGEDYSIETALIFGEVYRHNDEWKFKAVGQGFAGGLAPLCQGYGVNVG